MKKHLPYPWFPQNRVQIFYLLICLFEKLSQELRMGDRGHKIRKEEELIKEFVDYRYQ